VILEILEIDARSSVNLYIYQEIWRV